MPRDTPSALTAMQKIQLAAARERLKLDAAKARMIEEVAKYRPGFGPKNDLRKLSRDSWYYHETGQHILRVLIRAAIDEKIPDLLETLSTETFDMVDAYKGLALYLANEDEAKMEAAVLHRTTVEKLDAKNKLEMAEIRKDIDARYEVNRKRNLERDNRPI